MRIYIICEGQTEAEFVSQVLRPYLNHFQIYDVRGILLSTSKGSKGGDLKFTRYKSNIERLLKQESNILITSLIDFYQLKSDFPKFEEAQNIKDKNKKVDFIEDSIRQAINYPNFIPYIQLHEFEALLFSNVNALRDFKDAKQDIFQLTVEQFKNPELINEGDNTAPSKRMMKIIPGYQKVFHGNLIALSLGIENMIGKCPRFSNWVKQIINFGKLE